MSKLALLSTTLIAVAVLAPPAMARKSRVTSRHVAVDANANGMPGMGYIDGRPCRLAPRVGAFATAPWTNGPPCELVGY
jgi:hypothetical protein